MLKERIDNLIRKYSTFHFEGGNRNIIIFSTPRSGSTWLAELLATNKKIKLVREPLNIRKPAVMADLGISDWKHLEARENQQRIINYLKGFLTGSSSHLEHKREKPFSKTWHPITNRGLFKILHGGERIALDLMKGLDADALFLVRHPIPVAISRRSLPRLKTFIECEAFADLSSEQVNEARRVYLSGDPFETAVLDWCFQNKALFELFKAGKILMITYEELTVRPEKVLKLITERYHLRYDQDMQSRISKPSGSSGQSHQESKLLLDQVQFGDTDRLDLIRKWSGKITSQQENRAMEILVTFGIDLYETGNFMPKTKYLLYTDE